MDAPAHLPFYYREVVCRKAEKVKYGICGGKDVVIGKIEKNEKGEVFYLPCRTGKKTPWWNWGGKLE